MKYFSSAPIIAANVSYFIQLLEEDHIFLHSFAAYSIACGPHHRMSRHCHP